jgi:hypothetical protein
VIEARGDAQLRFWLARSLGRKTLRWVFVDERPVGGFGEI